MVAFLAGSNWISRYFENKREHARGSQEVWERLRSSRVFHAITPLPGLFGWWTPLLFFNLLTRAVVCSILSSCHIGLTLLVMSILFSLQIFLWCWAEKEPPWTSRNLRVSTILPLLSTSLGKAFFHITQHTFIFSCNKVCIWMYNFLNCFSVAIRNLTERFHLGYNSLKRFISVFVYIFPV